MAMILRTSLLALGVVCSTATTTGQVEPLEPVEAAIADTGALSVSLRQVEAGLRQPVGFNKVYRVPGQKGLLVRVQGGLYAVFPQSVYVRDRRGSRPVIPNNTTFYIGAPAFGEVGGSRSSNASAVATRPQQFAGRINTRIDPLPAGLVDSRRPLGAIDRLGRAATVRLPQERPMLEETGEPQTILSDASYRSQRLRSLMRRAARAQAQVNQRTGRR